MQVPLSPGYTDTQLPLTAQRMVNCYPVVAESEKGQRFVRDIIGAPGLKAWATVRAGYACRGLFAGEAYLYGVWGNTAYKINSSGTATSLGTLDTTSGHVWIESNLTESQVAFGDGTDVYTWTEGTTTWAKVADADKPNASSMTYQDGYLIISQEDSGRFYISAANDFTDWDGTDYANAEAYSDYLVAVFSFNRQMFAMGNKSTEVYYNSGDSDFPFTRYASVFVDDGLAAAAAIAKADNAWFYLSTDLQIKRMAGYTPQIISTRVIDKEIAGMDLVSDCVAFSYTFQGSEQVCFQFPTGDRTFIYDCASGAWFERETGTSGARWYGMYSALWAGKVLAGSRSTDGKLFELDADTYLDDSATIPFIYHTQELVGEDGFRAVHHRLTAEFEPGVGDVTTTDPQVTLKWTDNRGKSWSTGLDRSLGASGEYTTRMIWARLGSPRRRVYELKITDPVERKLHGLYLLATQGRA